MPPASQVFTIDEREEDLQKQNACKANSQQQHPGQEKLRCSLEEKAIRSHGFLRSKLIYLMVQKPL